MRNSCIYLRPVDKSQRYFWTEQWQDKIKQSQNALENGEYQTFESMEQAIEDLEKFANRIADSKYRCKMERKKNRKPLNPLWH